MKLRHVPFLLIVCILFLLPAAGCTTAESNTANGVVVTRDFDFSDFDQVSLGNGFEATVTRGDAYRVQVRVSELLEPFLVAEQDGRLVRIGLSTRQVENSPTLEVDIVMPALAMLDVSGGSEAALSGFDTAEPIAFTLAGGSKLTGELTSGDATFDVSGGSDVNLAGTGGTLAVSAEGGGTTDLSAFAVGDATVVASGGADVLVNPSGTLNADATGGSTITYSGSPTLGAINEDGGGEVRAR